MPCALADDRGAPVPAQLLPASRSTLGLQAAMAAADVLPDPAAAGKHELAFVATLPPLGYVTYSLEPCSDAEHDGEDPDSGPRAPRSLLVRPGAGARAETPRARVCARGGAAAASSRVTEWAPGRGAAPDLAGVGSGVGREGRLSLGSGRLALVLEAATGRTVALRTGNAVTELSTSAVGFCVRKGMHRYGGCAASCADGAGFQCLYCKGAVWHAYHSPSAQHLRMIAGADRPSIPARPGHALERRLGVAQQREHYLHILGISLKPDWQTAS